MTRTLALVATAGLALGACHKRDSSAGALDAGADARARTAAKTSADLAAAATASAAPLPRAVVDRPEREIARPVPTPAPDAAANEAEPNL